MTQSEWQVCTDPTQMLQFVGWGASDRKRRLYHCACCRRSWNAIPDPRSRDAVVAAERFADGEISADELEIAGNAASDAWPTKADEDHPGLPIYTASAAAYNVALDFGWWGGAPAFQPPADILRDISTYPDAEAAAQCNILRDIYNPFGDSTINPALLTDTVLGLARSIYTLRAYERQPILADALEDAGCDDMVLLDHCRADGLHHRGCWAVDHVLGLE